MTILTPDVIAREALMLLDGNLIAGSLMYRDYESEFNSGKKISDTVSIRRPADFTVVEFTGSENAAQAVNETSIDLVLERHFDVPIKITDAEMTLELDDFSGRILAPAMSKMAQAIDTYLLGKAYNFASVYASSTFAALSNFAGVRRELQDNLVPQMGRYILAGNGLEQDMLGIDAVISAEKRGDGGEALRSASVGHVMGFDIFSSPYWVETAQTAGAAALTLSTAAIAGATTITVGASATGYVTGERMSIAGYGDVKTTSAAAGVITLAEPLRKAVASGVAVTSVSSGTNYTPRGFAGHRNSLGFAMVPLVKPNGAKAAATISYKGLSCRVVYDYDFAIKTDKLSIDCLIGAKAIDPRLATLIADTA